MVLKGGLQSEKKEKGVASIDNRLEKTDSVTNPRVIPCQLDKLMSLWVENFEIDIFRGF
jgi:hypothetical protein